MVREPLQEDLVEELTRLVGRPKPIIQDVLARLLDALAENFDGAVLGCLATYPMTAWSAIAAPRLAARDLSDVALSAGLSPEEALTALAVLDDHVRRCYGADSWARLEDWGPRLRCRYELPTAAPAPSRRAFPSP